jgi:hypothetical protein
MSKKTTTVDLSLTVKTPINDILDVLKEKKKAFASISDSKYITHGNVSPFPNNIKDETSIETLISIHSSIKGRSEAFDKSCIDLGITKCKCWNLEGATAEDLIQDIKLRIAIINNKEEMDELNALMKEAENFMTIEDKKQAYLAKLEKFANK